MYKGKVYRRCVVGSILLIFLSLTSCIAEETRDDIYTNQPGSLGATCWVVANDAKTEVKAFAQSLQASGYPVWVCDSVDDNDEIQAAINSLTNGRTWIETVKCVGEFDPSSSIILPSYTRLDLTEAAFNWDHENILFYSTGTLGSSSNIVSNVSIGNNAISVADASIFNTGDYVSLYSEEMINGWKNGEIHQILSSDGINTVTLMGFAWDDYTTINGAALRKVNMVVDVEIIGGSVVGTSPTQANTHDVLRFTYVAKFKVLNMRISNVARIALMFANSVDGEVSGNHIYGVSQSGYGYGIVTSGACSNILVDRNIMQYVRHGTTGGGLSIKSWGGNAYGFPRFIRISNNKIRYSTKAAFDMHGGASVGIIYDGNEVAEAFSGIVCGAEEWTAQNNIISVRSGSAFGERNDTTQRVTLLDNTILKSNGGAIINSTAIQHVFIDGLDIKGQIGTCAVSVGNIGSGTRVNISNVNAPYGNIGPTYGIYITQVSDGEKEIKITDCVVGNFQRGGIVVITANATNGLIANNIVFNNNQAGSTTSAYRYSGIYLRNAGNFIITGNRCYDDQGTKTQRVGIYEANGSNNNYIHGNDVTGNLVTGIVKAGANTIVRANRGYVTENSGTATIPALGRRISFEHGLSATPTCVDVGFKTNPGTVLNWYWSANSTNITITVSPATVNQLDFSWNASVN